MKNDEQLKYWGILGIESLGAAILLFTGVPIYRALMFNPDSYVPDNQNLIWGIIAVILIQVPYWIKQNMQLVPNTPKSNFLSTSVSFLGRLLFVF